MFEHIYDNCHQFRILIKITDHKYDGNEIPISDGFIKSRYGNNLSEKNMGGCKLQVEWKDGSTS